MLAVNKQTILIWLAGLISTDGWIQWSNKERGYVSYGISSIEEDWRNAIVRQVKKIGIEATSKYPKVYLHNPQKLTQLFVENKCGEFFNPRKWKRVLKASKAYCKKHNYVRFTQEEDQILKRCLSIKQIQELLPNRTYGSIWYRRKFINGN